jgi:tRNA (cytidine/uridine-2'-O-)-methyltransferase
MKVVLYRPQIPQNTGNIVRTCRTAGADLLLIGPLGFSVTDRWLKRAGLDYWEGVNVTQSQDLDAELALLEQQNIPFFFLSSKVDRPYFSAELPQNAVFIFGSETEGLPDSLHDRYPDRFLTIPMEAGARCLNLATSVGIVVYECRRQLLQKQS